MPCNDEVFHFSGEVMTGELNLLPVDVSNGAAKQFSTKVLQISVHQCSLNVELHPIYETTLPSIV